MQVSINVVINERCLKLRMYVYHCSPEVSELGFVVIVDGRLLTWTEIKLILRTAQEALPGQVQLAYVIQPTQFMHKQQMVMSLSKEKDRLEFGVSVK